MSRLTKIKPSCSYSNEKTNFTKLVTEVGFHCVWNTSKRTKNPAC